MPAMTEESSLTTTLVQSLIEKGVTLDQLRQELRPAKPEAPAKVASRVPVAVITDDHRAALAELEKVFGKVVPEEVRALEDHEIASLLDERRVLDEIDALITKRKDGIRTTVLNHHDVLSDDNGEQDKDGHYLYARRIGVDSNEKEFSWEIGERGGGVDPNALRDGLSHEDWLAITDQTRVLNGDKVMQLLKAKPELADVLAEAINPGVKVGSLNVRKKQQ